jgi:hypothetical protein
LCGLERRCSWHRDRQQIADSTFKITIWIITTLSPPFQHHIPLALPLENQPVPIFPSLNLLSNVINVAVEYGIPCTLNSPSSAP